MAILAEESEAAVFGWRWGQNVSAHVVGIDGGARAGYGEGPAKME